MIDYLLSFADEATAQADPVVGAYWRAATTGAIASPGRWRGECVIPNVQVWNPAQDTTAQVASPLGGGTVSVVTHAYQPGWFIWISKAAADPALAGHAALEIAADSVIADSGAPASEYVTYSKAPLATVLSLMLGNVFAGRAYQFGQS